jgi:fructokinase
VGKVVCLGEALIDFIAADVSPSLAAVRAFVPAVGGSPANTAVALARLGLPVSFVGQVGDDPFGRMIARTLAAAGVDVSGLAFASEVRTALAFVALDADGLPDFVFFRHPGADQRFSDADAVDVALLGASCLHTGSIFLTDEPSRSSALRAMRVAREAGLLVTFDPNIRASVWPSRAEMLETINLAYALANVVRLSAEDCAAIGEGDPLPYARGLLARGPTLVVVTRGGRGCSAVTRSCAVDLPAYKVDVVDTTGAGDAFSGGLIAALLTTGVSERLASVEVGELASVLRVASAVGGLTTTRRGALTALPTRDALADFLQTQGDEAATAIVARFGGNG